MGLAAATAAAAAAPADEATLATAASAMEQEATAGTASKRKHEADATFAAEENVVCEVAAKEEDDEVDRRETGETAAKRPRHIGAEAEDASAPPTPPVTPE